MATAMIRGAECSFDLQGEGPPVVLLHSVGLSTREGWRAQMPVLSERYRVLSHDFRGLGHSAKGDKPAEVATYVADLAALLDHVGIERAVLVGVSLGGFVAQAFALAHPDRVRALVLVSTACRIAAGNSGARAERNRRIRAEGMEVAADTQLETHFEPDFLAAHPDVLSWYRGHYVANDPETYTAIMEDLGQFDSCSRLGEIRCPTLVLAGSKDASNVAGGVPGRAARVLADGIPNARLAIIEGCHHYPQIEKAEEFNAQVIGFLESLETAESGGRNG